MRNHDDINPRGSADSAISAVERDGIHGEIEFRDLTFRYGETEVLSHVTARLPAGQTTAIVGETGSGKSTLIGLLARLHEPPPGTVFIDGIDVRDWPLHVLRERHRFRAAGAVPVLRHDRRQRRVRAGRPPLSR